MSRRRCRENVCENIREDRGCGFSSLCTNPICAIIILIILQRTCLLENKNAFLLILIFIGFCCCRGRFGGEAVKSCGC